MLLQIGMVCAHNNSNRMDVLHFQAGRCQEQNLGRQGYLSVNYSDNYYKLSQRFPEVPRLTPAHYEAMALFNELAKCAAWFMPILLVMLLSCSLLLCALHACDYASAVSFSRPVSGCCFTMCRRMQLKAVQLHWS